MIWQIFQALDFFPSVVRIRINGHFFSEEVFLD